MTFFFVLSRERRQALMDFYAFCRLADDIADEAGLTAERRHSLLNSIRAWLRENKKIAHPFWDRLLDEIAAFKIPHEVLFGVLDGVAIDIESPLRIPTWVDLDRYVYGVACCVGEGVLAILGAHHARAKDYALQMGRCLQYLNIMRDIEEDFENTRVYIPQEFLRSFGISDERLSLLAPENLKIIRQELFSRAMKFRADAHPYSIQCFAPELMAGIYFEGARKYWRFGNPQRLKKFQKLWAIAKTSVKFLWNILLRTKNISNV